MLPDKEIERLNKLKIVSEDQFFKYCESLVDVKRFNNIREWINKRKYKKGKKISVK
ncbi:hypothetical protein ES704_03635 [subsurface metagenome]|jgi:hypothetical protein